MLRFAHPSLVAILSILWLALAGPSLAAGPFTYFGVDPDGDGSDAVAVDYPNVGPTQTQKVTAFVNLGDANVPGVHFGIGLRGPSFDQGLPLGRGIIWGSFPGATNGCVGVAVEDFTLNRSSGAGIISGTCKPFTFKPNTTYRFEVSATVDDVSYVISERFYDPELRRWDYLPKIWGGCLATASTTCAQQTADGNAGDVFIGSTHGASAQHLSWSSQLFISHQ